jgi:template-activating factor I
LDVEEFEDIKSGYKIKLHFRENSFFSNDELVKEFRLGATGERYAWLMYRM